MKPFRNRTTMNKKAKDVGSPNAEKDIANHFLCFWPVSFSLLFATHTANQRHHPFSERLLLHKRKPHKNKYKA